MTAFAFILGVVPLMLASGAGAASQNVMGTSVFWGMLVATALGVFLIPGNFAFVETLALAGARSPRWPRRRRDGQAGGALMRRLALLAPALLLAACTVGPDYARPPIDTPPEFRGATASPTEPSLAEQAWWQIFPDETLQALIREGLAHNYDVRIAATRILDARAQVTIARSFQFPEVRRLRERPLSAGGGYALAAADAGDTRPLGRARSGL